MKSHRRSRLAAAGVALALTATLAGCAGAHPGAAAVADGQVVAEQDVNTAVRELSDLPQAPTPDAATQLLVIGPILERHLREAGVVVSDDEARQMLPDPQRQVAQPTVDVLRAMAAITTLNQAEQVAQQPGAVEPGFDAQAVLGAGEATTEEINDGVQTGRIELNPKYMQGAENWVQQDQTQMMVPQDTP